MGMASSEASSDDDGEVLSGQELLCDKCFGNEVRDITIGHLTRPLCKNCVGRETMFKVPTHRPEDVAWYLLVRATDATCNVVEFSLEQLWHWPVCVGQETLQSFPVNSHLVYRRADQRLPAANLSLIKWMIAAGTEKIQTRRVVGNQQAELRLSIRRLLIDTVACDVTSSHRMWSIDSWDTPQEPTPSGYRATLGVVRREETELPQLLMDMCGFPREVAMLAYSYRRRYHALQKHYDTLAATQRAITQARASVDALLVEDDVKANAEQFAAKIETLSAKAPKTTTTYKPRARRAADDDDRDLSSKRQRVSALVE